ncbi:MAG TPA: hypothetical protein VF109_03655, partial [Mycobacteriales bacterium]
ICDVVTVFIPEYVVGHWWEHLLHNQSALRIKTRLLFEPGVMVTSVPWQLESSAKAARRSARSGPGDVRRGLDVRAAHTLGGGISHPPGAPGASGAPGGAEAPGGRDATAPARTGGPAEPGS